jgi:hypothetical protein
MLEGESLQAALEEIQPQAIQATLFRSRRFSSIRYPSAANLKGKCIVVFPDRMHPGESVAVLDEDSIINQILTVAAAT